jgi:hypothetical protein
VGRNEARNGGRVGSGLLGLNFLGLKGARGAS